MKYCIYDKVTDQYECARNDEWSSWNSEGLSSDEPLMFDLKEDATEHLKELERLFRKADPTCQLAFEVLRVDEKTYYKFYD